MDMNDAIRLCWTADYSLPATREELGTRICERLSREANELEAIRLSLTPGELEVWVDSGLLTMEVELRLALRNLAERYYNRPKRRHQAARLLEGRCHAIH